MVKSRHCASSINIIERRTLYISKKGGSYETLSTKVIVDFCNTYFYDFLYFLCSSSADGLSPSCNEAGYKPYPRSVISVKSNNKYCELLDNAYGKVGGSITKFLLTNIRKNIYEDAAKALNNYKVKYSENKEILAHAQATIQLVKPGVPIITIEPK
jgi:hypothetical protein